MPSLLSLSLTQRGSLSPSLSLSTIFPGLCAFSPFNKLLSGFRILCSLLAHTRSFHLLWRFWLLVQSQLCSWLLPVNSLSFLSRLFPLPWLSHQHPKDLLPGTSICHTKLVSTPAHVGDFILFLKYVESLVSLHLHSLGTLHLSGVQAWFFCADLSSLHSNLSTLLCVSCW